jgi:glycosyltransferase involved in cell wall biosynthesis
MGAIVGTDIVAFFDGNDQPVPGCPAPDFRFDTAQLDRVDRACARCGPRLLLVGHDSRPGSAQCLLLDIGRTLLTDGAIGFEYLLLAGGDLAPAYAALARVNISTSDAPIAALPHDGFTGAIVNSAAAARAVGHLRAANIRPVLLMHEIPRIRREKQFIEDARAGLSQAATIVFPSQSVRDAVFNVTGLAADGRSVILPHGAQRHFRYDPAAASTIRREFSLKQADHLILGIGYADMRRGFDLFLQLWRALQAATETRFYLLWVGGIDPALNRWFAPEIAAATAAGTFRMAGYRNDVAGLLSAATAFALTARAEPLTAVVMDALAAGCPVVAFDGTGGAADLLRGLAEGTVVRNGDAAAMALTIRALAATTITLRERKARHAKIASSCGLPAYVEKLVGLALPKQARKEELLF